MRRLVAVLCCLVPAYGAVEGVVTNATAGKPQAKVVVSLMQPGSAGMKTLGSVNSDPEGRFKIEKEIPPGPAIVQAIYQGATYNLILTPGTPTVNLDLKVYDSTAKSGIAEVSQDMLVIEPGAGSLDVSETMLVKNDTKLTFQDPVRGSVRFYVPGPAPDKLQITVSAPGGMPIQRPAQKTGEAGVYRIDYPVKPGETRFDIAYSLPPSDTFRGRSLHTEGATRLVTAPGVTLTGDKIEPIGQEPQTQAHIYNVTGQTFEAKIEGLGSLRVPEGTAQEEDNGSPKVEEAPARIYSRLGWVLGFAAGILALGGTLLFRRGAA